MKAKRLFISIFCAAMLAIFAHHAIAAGPSTDVVPVQESDSAVQAVEKININQADPAMLVKLPGIGPVTAQRIAEYREVNGPFKTVDELLTIKGIGADKLEKIKLLVTAS